MPFPTHRPSTGHLEAVPAPTPPPDWRKWWHDTDNPEQDRRHRLLIASPWERYLLDRDDAETDDDDPAA